MSKLQLQNISKAIPFRNVKILSGITYTFSPGNIYALIGESGVGKSTLLRILAGLDSRYEGSVVYGQTNIPKDDEVSRAAFRRGCLGIQFQNFALCENLSALDNIALPIILEDGNLSHGYALAKNLLKLLRFTSDENVCVKNLSGGERQRVAIARALIKKSPVLIFDEPTGNLDLENEKSVLSLISYATKELNSCAIIATHSTYLVNHADYVLKLSHTAEGAVLDE